ncbi:MAG: DUF2244 domain-containing protein [Pseudomonadota bacterium]|nr:DUF2244 domain-containing protein [Pseudomonadota bacterium]
MREIETAGVQTPAVFRSEPPLYAVTLWPHQALSPRGFAIVMGGTGVMLCVPLIPLLGSKVGLGLAPFLAVTLAALGFFLRRNFRDLSLREELRLWPDRVEVVRREPRGRVLTWEANPYWVSLRLRPDGRPENYLTLKGAGREIELGAFLSPEERADLAAELEEALMRARTHVAAAPHRNDA